MSTRFILPYVQNCFKLSLIGTCVDENHDTNTDYTQIIYNPFFNFLEYLPKDFVLTTRNSLGHFNTRILIKTSNIILKSFQDNPLNLKYHLDIDDTNNVIGKFEKILQGEMIHFNDDDFTTFNEIYKIFNDNVSKIKITNNFPKVYINKHACYNLFFNDFPQTFTIRTKKNEYKCNQYGVFSSSVIREILAKNPNADFYEYDIEDENGEFEFIHDIFNFNYLKITKTNIEVIKQIAEDLGIDYLLEFIDKNIKSTEKFSKYIENQQEIIDEIDNLFDKIYHIKESTIENIVNFIINSSMIKTNENIYELAAIFFQVVETSISLHKYIIDLLIELDKNKNTINQLEILLPFVIKQSLSLYKNNENWIIPFLYQLYNKGFIQKEDLSFQLTDNWTFNSWFLPEILEMNPNIHSINIESHLVYYNNSDLDSKKNTYQIEKYKQMRDKGCDDDEIKLALQNDDIDTFQAIISKNIDVLLKGEIKPNMFEPFIFKKLRYLNYAAAYGSLNCFKYMLNNNEKIDESTFEMAIIGGNTEIIRITNQRNNDNDFYSLLSGLYQSLKRHKNKIFDWIFDGNFDKFNENKTIIRLISWSIKYGNIHTFIKLVDNCFNITKFTITSYEFIYIAATKRFNFLLDLLINLFDDASNIFMFNLHLDEIVETRNIKVIQFLEKIMNENNYADTICFSTSSNNFYIAEYFIKTIHDNNHKFNFKNSIKILTCYAKYISNDSFNSLLDMLIEICPLNVVAFIQIINQTYQLKNINFIYKKIADSIYECNSSNDFTEVSIVLLKLKLKEIFIYFATKKYRINYIALFEYLINDDKTIDKDISQIIMNNLDCESKEKFKNNLVVQKGNYMETNLIYAVKANDLSMVKFILKDKVDTSYINMISRFGTALMLAVKNSNLEILNKLLSIKGIDPSVYDKNFKTPLILSFDQANDDIFYSIFNFYGEDIKKQKWQLEKIVISIINDDSKICESNIHKLKRIIDLNCIDPNLRVSTNTILTYACKNNLIDVVEKILQYDSVDVNLNIPATGDTPLITSVKNYNYKITKMLIKHPKTDFNILNYKRKSAFIYATQLNQTEIVDLLLSSPKTNKNEKSFFLSKIDKLKQYLISIYSEINFYNQKILHENIPINIKATRQNQYDFTISFPNVLSRNLNEPIVSQEYFTGAICANYTIDFKKQLFTFNVTDYAGTGGFIKSEITFLNQISDHSKKMNLSFLYCYSDHQKSEILPISKEDCLDPKKRWLFDDAIKIRIKFWSCCSHKNYLYPVLAANSSGHSYRFKFLIPISLFNQDKKDKTIDFPVVYIRSFNIRPSISYYYDKNKIKIHTNFKIENAPDDEPLIDLIFWYENNNRNKNFYSVFPNIETDYVQMPIFSPEETLEKDGFVFTSKESKKVIHLCLTIYYACSFIAKFPLLSNHEKTEENYDLFVELVKNYQLVFE